VAPKKTTKAGAHAPKSLVDKLDIFAIALDSLRASLDRAEFWSVNGEGESSTRRRIRSEYKVTDFDEGHLDIEATFHFRVTAEGREDALLSIDATYSAHFHPKSPVSRKEADEFAAGEARLIFWPYFRQIVSDTTARMHIPPVTLPFVVS
jgi:hypothetical protein